MSDPQERREQAKQDAQQRELEDQLTDKAQTHLRKAREAEKQADPSKMSPEDRALYHYLQAVTTVLEQDYDILLEAQQP
jgi:Skp family chaperone for outer membrane proteins